MEAAEFPDGFVAGSQKEMVRVAENDLGVKVVQKVAWEDAFNGSLGADRHEDRSLDIAMRGVEDAGARSCFGAGCL